MRGIQTILKKAKLRYNEYYEMQEIYDRLYADSKNGNNFYKLIEMIGAEENIRLAYRRLKTNKGSKTAGTDGLTIKDIWNITDSELIAKIRNMLSYYQPNPVRRVWIPKNNSAEKRPLGIPTIWDRLFQQCIVQVLEPICEAKFHNHSYGFRPNRSAHHAVSRVVSLINLGKHYYCVDIDIKGFFDNVSHGKLLRQMWALGIRDKRLISIIGRLLKSEIVGEGIPHCGTPQGGIISPLLSNIVLNELDWWVSNQWETYNAKRFVGKGSFHPYARKYTNLKDGFIVRYADDFKIMCRNYVDAQRYYHATVSFLKERLGLEINHKKSKVVNLKRNSSDFLGFKIKVIEKQSSRYGYVAKTDMNDKAIQSAKETLKSKVKKIQSKPDSRNVTNYNLAVLGIQNYYKIATNIYNNLTVIRYALLKTTRIRLKSCFKVIRYQDTTNGFKNLVKGILPNTQIYQVMNTPLLPITGKNHYSPRNFSQDTCDYTRTGRDKIHKNLTCIPRDVLRQVRQSYSQNRTIEYNDNRLSRYIAQYGKCHVTKQILGMDRIHCHHITPIKLGGDDGYHNLVIVDWDIHKLIHATNPVKIRELLELIKLSGTQLEKLNNLRNYAGNQPIHHSFTNL